MGGIAFVEDERVNVFTVLKRNGRHVTPNGTITAIWLCRCGICNKTKNLSTQAIQKHKSCGCLQRIRGYKVRGSGKRSPIGTLVPINTLLSIYKSNANKRNIGFSLTYGEFNSLVNSNCHYCGDLGDNILRKKNYPDFSYTGIDRVDNTKGYNSQNVVSCCKWCNRAKNKHGLEFFIDKCKKVQARSIMSPDSGSR